MIKGTQQRQLEFGYQVISTPAITTGTTNLPQTGTVALFTVTGGLVLVTSLIGVVTVVFAGTNPVLSLGLAPTGHTAVTNGIATTVDTSSAEVGTVMSVVGSGGLPTALAVAATAAKAGTAVFPGLSPFVAQTGTITWTTGASKTGAMKWYLSYVPIDAGASVS